MAESIVVNAKTQRPGVCNAAEQLLVHAGRRRMPSCPAWDRRSRPKGVRAALRPRRRPAILGRPGVARDGGDPGRLHREFLDLVAAVRVVASLDEAIATINRDGSAHSDAIVTADAAAADRFLAGRRQRRGVLERQHAVQRRVRVRVRRRDRDQHRPPARARADGPAGTLQLQVARDRHRPGPRIAVRPAQLAPPRIGLRGTSSGARFL